MVGRPGKFLNVRLVHTFCSPVQNQIHSPVHSSLQSLGFVPSYWVDSGSKQITHAHSNVVPKGFITQILVHIFSIDANHHLGLGECIGR